MNRIAENTEQADPFCCRTEWQFSFHEAFNQQRNLYFRNSKDSIIAFAGYDHPNVGFVLEPIESNWCFGSPLLGPESVELLEALLQEEPFCLVQPFILLSGLIPESSLFLNVLKTFNKQFEIIKLASSTTQCASLSGNVDGYLSRRSSKFGKNIRQSALRLADKSVFFERCLPISIEQADKAYARMLSVEETSWKGIGQCGMNVQPSQDFYWLMLRRLSLSGKGRIIFAKNDCRDIGFIFGGITGQNYRGQQFSYAEDWSSYSIGNLLQLEQIRWLCEEGIARYDLGQAIDYKAYWAELELRTENVLLRPRNQMR